MSEQHTHPPAGDAPHFPDIPKPEPGSAPVEGFKEEPTTHFPEANQAAPTPPGGRKPARLDQDPGGGYRPNNTYPQT